ncbi:MAG TPA: hypothetical protein EYG68_02070 [Leucothrix mucor]|nr:hypothetical protein [Leucothrix mucor]
MENKDFERKLQRGYEEMLDNVRNFIEKEGKTVKDAVNASEDKLSEWGELTREEVFKISQEVRDDVGHFGETWNEAKDYFHERLSLDADYIKDSVWDKLSGIANNATLDFIEFQKDLQERVEGIAEDFHQDEHQEHNVWRSDREFWLVEIDLWQQEHKKAEEKLNAIAKNIDQHGELLQQHVQTIRLHEEVDHKHEETLAAVEKDPSSKVRQDKNAEGDKEHEQMRDLHKEQTVFHAKLKEEHRKSMVLIEKLYKLSNK